MERSVPTWQMAGLVFTSILGTFLHFLFDLTDGSIGMALFSAVNESIWEHMKLLFYPMLLFAVLEYFSWGREMPQFWWIKLMGIGFGLLLIPLLYYSYTGVLGMEADWFNITIFFLVAGAAYWLETVLFAKMQAVSLPSWVAVAVLAAISVLFTVLTFLPPYIPLFQDPVSGTYGFYKQ